MAKTIVKVYEITYILGATINPETKTIVIDTINSLTEDFIKDEILRKHPNYKNQIGPILSTILIDEKVIGGEDIKEQEFNNKDNKKIPVFNW